MRLKVSVLALSALFAAPALAQEAQPAAQGAQTTPAALTQADFTAGAQIHDTSGNVIGTVDSANADGVVISLGTARVQVPYHSIAKHDDKFVMAMTREQLLAAAAQSRVTAATLADLTEGAQVRDSEGVVVGTVESADAEGAVVRLDGDKRVLLPVSGFGKSTDGLVIGMTKAQLEAAIAGGA